MTDSFTYTDGVDVPKPDKWPGAFESFKIVKPYIKPQIWNFVSIIGLSLAGLLIIEAILEVIFKDSFTASLLVDVAGILVGAFLQAVAITMYYASLRADEFTLQTAINYGFQRWLKMIGLIVVIYIIGTASLILLIIPFFFIAPRLILAPYYLILNDCTVSEALAASWHSTKAKLKIIYGLLGIELLILLAFITIIGIPFAIYWGIINSGSFALLTLYLSQPKKKIKLKKA